MANQEQVDLLMQGAWNEWRQKNFNIEDPDLTNAMLRGASLIEANLINANLSGADLSGADLSGANLTYASLSGADLSSTNLSRANLTYASLNGINFNYANLSNAKLTKADLSNADLKSVTLTNAKLTNANLSNADLSNADLSGADLRSADLRNAKLANADFKCATLTGATLTNADLSNANFREANLNGANLQQAKLFGAYLSWANLSDTNLSSSNLFGAYLREANLSQANLRNANLSRANFFWPDIRAIHVPGSMKLFSPSWLDSVLPDGVPFAGNLLRTGFKDAVPYGANLTGADLSQANLTGADLRDANLSWANLSGANLNEANLTGCLVYATSAWDVQLEQTIQTNLIITSPSDPKIPSISVDNLEVAQFVYLLLNNEKIRKVVDTITSKVVLILGRFTSERKTILDSIRNELRTYDYLPILFDFEKPASRNFTETVRTLAHLARFIIADLTDPSSIPQELYAIVPTLAVPVRPVLLEGKKEYAMLIDLLSTYHWMLPIHFYKDQADLLATLKEQVIAPAEAKALELKNR